MSVDNLKEDPEIPGQKFCIVSIVNPKDRSVLKNLYYTNRFLVDDINKNILAQACHMVKKLATDMRSKIDDVLERLRLSTDEESKHLYRILNSKFCSMVVDEQKFIEECNRKYSIDEKEILDKYKMFIAENRNKLDSEFDKSHGDGNSICGVKIRGTFQTYDEAEEKCKYLVQNHEPAVHAYIVNVGVWFPIDFEADEIQDQEYMLHSLNDLMGKYHEGMRAKDAFYNERKMEMTNTNPTKTRLQKKLQKMKNERIRKEISEFRLLQNGK